MSDTPFAGGPEEKGSQVRFINCRHTVPAQGYAFLEARSPVTGNISHILFHFPEGCEGLVFVRVHINKEAVWPISNEWIALDDATPLYQFPAPYQIIKKQDYLGVEIQNLDKANPHTITVLFTLIGRL